MSARVSIAINSPEEARELFLLKVHQNDVSRDKLNELMKEFKRHNISKNPQGKLTENELLLLLEDLGEPKTAIELRNLLSSEADVKHLDFLHFLCVFYKKTYEDINSFPNDEAKSSVLAEAKAAAERAAAIEKEIEEARLRQELEDEKRAEELENESRLKGVSGMAAFFSRQIEKVQDKSASLEFMVKEEAARRRKLRDAKNKEKEALEALKKCELTASEVKDELVDRRKRISWEHAQVVARRQAEERAARNQRKNQLNEIWAGPK